MTVYRQSYQGLAMARHHALLHVAIHKHATIAPSSSNGAIIAAMEAIQLRLSLKGLASKKGNK